MTEIGSRSTAEGVGSPREGEPIVDLAVKINLLDSRGRLFVGQREAGLGFGATRTWPPTRSTSTPICTEARAASFCFGAAAQTPK